VTLHDVLIADEGVVAALHQILTAFDLVVVSFGYLVVTAEDCIE
jgi:hypothetical protein